jgi:hypothetical protein
MLASKQVVNKAPYTNGGKDYSYTALIRYPGSVSGYTLAGTCSSMLWE